MQNTKNLILSLLLLVLLTSFASAQEAGTFHVFPMVTAGELDNGSEWDGTFIATNVDGRPTTCSLELIGMPLTNIDGQGSLASQGSVQLATKERAAGLIVVSPSGGGAAPTGSNTCTKVAVTA